VVRQGIDSRIIHYELLPVGLRIAADCVSACAFRNAFAAEVRVLVEEIGDHEGEPTCHVDNQTPKHEDTYLILSHISHSFHKIEEACSFVFRLRTALNRLEQRLFI
jgi:hypothetical protein